MEETKIDGLESPHRTEHPVKNFFRKTSKMSGRDRVEYELGISIYILPGFDINGLESPAHRTEQPPKCPHATASSTNSAFCVNTTSSPFAWCTYQHTLHCRLPLDCILSIAYLVSTTMTSNEFDWAQGMLCRIGTCQLLPCQFTRNIIHKLLQPNIMMDLVYLRLFLVLLVRMPTESQCHVIHTIIDDADFKASLDEYFQNFFNDSSTAKTIVAVVHEQKHFYLMQADFNTHTVWVDDSAVTNTSVSVSVAMTMRAHIFVKGCAERIKDANTQICTKVRANGPLCYGGERKPTKKKRQNFQAWIVKYINKQNKQTPDVNACACYTAYDLCTTLRLDPNLDNLDDPKVAIRGWFVSWVIRETRAAYLSGVMSLDDGASQENIDSWKELMDAWIANIPDGNDITSWAAEPEVTKERVAELGNTTPPDAKQRLFEEARVVEESVDAKAERRTRVEDEAAKKAAAAEKGAKTLAEQTAAAEAKQLDEQKAKEAAEKARAHAEAEKKAAAAEKAAKTLKAQTEKKAAAEAKHLDEQKAKEAEKKARVHAEAEKKAAAAEKEAKKLDQQEEALAAEDKRVAEDEAAGGWVSAEQHVSEEEEVDRCDEYVRREAALEEAERVLKRPMVNSVQQDAECAKRRKASLDLDLMRGPLIHVPEANVPIEAAGRSIIIAGRRNMVVAENFDPSQLGAASLPGLDDLCNRHLALDDVEKLVYFWYGAMLFAFVRTDHYQLEGVKALLRKRFHPVAPKEALRCNHCSQTFYNPVQARHHETCWETNGMCKPGMESMSIAGPPAFYLPTYLLDFLGLWEHGILDLLDACRVPVAIVGKPNTSTHKYLPHEIYKEKLALMKKKGLEHLLTHKSDHLWGDRKRDQISEARDFGKERFRIVPELPHLSFLLPLNMWPPELSAPFFARCKPSSFGRYYYQTEVEIEDEGAGVKDEGAVVKNEADGII